LFKAKSDTRLGRVKSGITIKIFSELFEIEKTRKNGGVRN